MLIGPTSTFFLESAPVSKICHIFKVVFKKEFQSMQGLADNERCYLLSLLENRMDFLYHDAISFANPHYLGDSQRKKRD